MPSDQQVPSKFSGYAALQKGLEVSKYEYEPGPLQPRDIDIRVTHNGLCHTDIHMTLDDWGVSKFPFIPGHEVVGYVAAKGSEVRHLEVGDRVGYAWIKDSCHGCQNCYTGHENLCLKGYTGLITGGGMGGWQNYMRAPAYFAFKIPDGLDSVSAAPLLCAGVTVYAPLKRLITKPGTRVSVIGIGGLGHLALQFAAALGAEVTAISTSPDKEAEARKFGATNFVVGEEGCKAISGTQDVVINTVSSKNDYEAQMALLRPDGTLCIVGLPVDKITVGVLDVVFNQKKICGSIVGGRSDMAEMLQFAAIKGIKPQCETMPLSQVNEAVQKVLANKARYRIVLVNDS
ncbi:hypothetical protein CEUSTIGMA_g54.t1 [Chlamydomonas eustigma]|uniref:alcohol dehydrogenase (NADP(+)) n=1 Tax=Chlamydomonas eustigma TaxID=1157962 RepID=A0A250WP49_9CHLO|nr:hypothetical protein CEUSTIGMA_g54.t1 [Chlamydomonas eustigma]|eukprot:GAX72598.1 hypothetical protein CEUSTIGMA_g54.t1 [Chlamydomonas eustigma]